MTKCTHRGEHSHLEEAWPVPYFHILFVDPVSWAFIPVSSKAIFTASEQKERPNPRQIPSLENFLHSVHKTTEPQYALEQEFQDSVHLLLLCSMKCKLLNWLTIFHFTPTTLSCLLALTQQKAHFSTKKKPILHISTHNTPSLMEPGRRTLIKKTQTA
jgi:hypothetical protein